MSKVLVAFGSLTGNTMSVAEWVTETLKDEGHSTEMMDCADVSSPKGLCGPYDLIVLGSPTYGDDPCEVQEDFEPVLDALESTGVQGKRVAVFGCGDSTYTYFCGAVDMIVDRVKECGGNLIAEPLKIDDPHDDHEDEIRDWAKGVAAVA